MNGTDLLKGLSFVDERLVSEAEEKKIKKPGVQFALPIAASFAVMITIASVWSARQSDLPPSVDNNPQITNSASASLEKSYSLYYNETDRQLAASLRIEGHFWEELTALQAEELLPNLAKRFQIDGMVNYSHVSGVTSIFSVNMSACAQGKEVKITLAPNEVMKCYVIAGEPVFSEIEGVKIEAGIFTTSYNSSGNQNHIYYADFKLNDVAYHVEYSGEKNDKDFFASILADMILGGKADLSVLDHPAVPELRNDTLSEREAYAETTFGAYLPKVPGNYLFNSATRFINQDSNYLFASWSNQYEDVSVTISRLEERDRERIVSEQDKELYDMSLYPIPWADSIPSESREIIENPIFKIEDLTLGILKMRAYVRGEQGDPSGNSVNMRFSVLYDDVLVELSTEGVTSEFLFDVLSKIPKN